MSQLSEFQALAQSGQEMSRESLWPAEVQFEGTTTVVPCSGGSRNQTGSDFVSGGTVPTFDVSFRIRRNAAPVPRMESKFRWRRAGETQWSPLLRIIRLQEPAGAPTYSIEGSSVEK